MTVRELIAKLSECDQDAEVLAMWDTMPVWDVHAVFPCEGRVIINVDSHDRDVRSEADLREQGYID